MNLGKGLAIFVYLFKEPAFSLIDIFYFFCSLYFIYSCSHLYALFPSANFVFCSFFFL